jgi:branched-chain amino acid transport system ATP-binding protein
VIAIKNLTVRFGSIVPINGLTAELTANVVGLIGPNGAGKTTLLNALSGFVTSSAGSVEVDGVEILRLRPNRRAEVGLRRTFQTEQIADDLSVWDNVLAFAEHVVPAEGAPSHDVDRALRYVDLASIAAKRGSALNLFERRMVELARALVGKPRVILMDEPGAGLNEGEVVSLRQCIGGIHSAFGAQVLLIDHDIDLIAAACSETLALDFGKRLALGLTRVVLEDPSVRSAYLGTA